MDPDSELYGFAPNAVLIQMCTEKLYEAFCASPAGSRASFAEEMYTRIAGIWEQINSRIRTTILQCNFPLKILTTAGEHGFRKVIGEYIPTAKNAMVKDLYEKMGFVRVGENRFEAQTDGFQYHKTFIEEE